MKTMTQQSQPAKQKGVVLILVAVSLIVLAGFAAISIDSGRAYGTRAQLSAATDAAAIAGARQLASGNTPAQRIANAKAAADQFFNLNFPAGTRGTNVTPPVTSVTQLGNGQWQVNVSSRVTMPTTFARVLGFNQTPIAAVGQTLRRDLDLVMVLDVSGSMKSAMGDLKTAAKEGFVEKFIPDAGGDRLGLVSFSAGAVVDEPINRTGTRGFNKSRIDNAIDALTDHGRTASSGGMLKGINELRAVPGGIRSSLRIMLVFSDGAPNVFGVTLPGPGGPVDVNIEGQLSNNRPYLPAVQAKRDPNDLARTLPGAPDMLAMPSTGMGGIPTAGRRSLSGSLTRCDLSKVSRNMMENAADLARDEGIVVYSIGLGAILKSVEANPCGYGSDERGEVLLRRVANSKDADSYDSSLPTGLYCHAEVPAELKSCFTKIATDIIRLTM